MRPVAEVDCVSGLPGHDVALGVLAEDLGFSVAVEGGGGGVGC